ncbi:MAG: serine/threonine-protein kinase [Myxococcota bacterium]
MARSQVNAITQSCPNCGKVHDVGVYVSGQQVTCTCGIRFEVKRTDVRPSMAPPRREALPTVGARPAVAQPADAASPPAPPASSSVPVEVVLENTIASGSGKADGNVTTVAAPPQVPGYELLELLGKGGMGEVWKARQLSLNRVVALKVLPEKFARDTEFVKRFEKEATALAALSHPNIVQIIDRGQAGDHVFFTMELVPGINLRELMNNQKLSVRDALRIGSQVARAIDYAHEQKVVHRDLKPENILVDARGHVKIADFGLAGMHGSERDISLTATAVAMGTVNYMAPEQRRDAKHVDHRADLYSLGVILYEMLTGELPIGRFKPPSQKVAELDPEVDEVVHHLLETEPDARPKRALETAQALEELTPLPMGTTPPGTRRRSSIGPTTSKPPSFIDQPAAGWKLGVFVLAALLAVGLGLKFWPSTPEPPPVPSTPPPWYEDAETELFASFSTEATRLTLDFEPASEEAGEEINVHTGAWTLVNGTLQSTQYGDPLEGGAMLPRAYVAHRYWSSDDFEAAVDVEVESLPKDFPPVDPETSQRFAELAFRIKDLQVSVFAIPGTDMRLGWRYFTPEGQEHQGNSTRDLVNELVEDAVKVPRGTFRVRLKLEKLKNGDVTVQAWVNKTRFVRTVLPGMAGQVGKVALGCRNLVCRFDNLEVTGKPQERPKRFVTATPE